MRQLCGPLSMARGHLWDEREGGPGDGGALFHHREPQRQSLQLHTTCCRPPSIKF